MNRSVWWVLALLALCCMLSCQRLADEEEAVSAGNNATLKVAARSGGAAQVIYPVYLYAFSEEGECVTSQRIDSEDGRMEFLLPLGTYRVVVISGVSKGYILPENPSAGDMITMRSGNCAQSPMMMGKADVTIGKSSKDVHLEVTLAYAVASLSIDLKRVPAEVSGVKVCISPLYSSLSFDGEYGGQAGRAEVDCTLDSDGIWCANSLYIFPGSGAETVLSIHLETAGGTETYSYTYRGAPLANHPFNLGGNYNGQVTVGGGFITKEWDTPVDVDFSFGDQGDAGEGDGGEGGGGSGDVPGWPEAGSIWNGCIVADAGKPDGNGADLLLLSLDEWYGTIAEADGAIAGYSVNGIKGWRFPTETEAKLIRDRFNGSALDALNERIVAHNRNNEAISGDEEARYLCDKAGVFYSFRFAAGKSVTKAGTQKAYLIRAVATYRYSK